MLWFVIATVVVLLLVTMITNGIGSLTNQEITYSEFQKMVKNNQVKSVVITNSEIQIQPVEDKKSLYQVTYYTVNLKDDRMYEMLDQYNVDYTGKNQTTSAWIYQILSFVIPIAIVWILLGAAMKRMGGGGGVMGVGKSNAKMYVEKSTGVTFKDVAGQDEAKESLQEVVQIFARACPMFVPLVENGYFNDGNPVTKLIIAEYLQELKDAGVDTLILGCTHYPLLKKMIGDFMGDEVHLVDSGKVTAQAAAAALDDLGLLNGKKTGGTARYFVSDTPDNFDELAHTFLGEYAGGTVERIAIETY